jgi:hypothetical protein
MCPLSDGLSAGGTERKTIKIDEIYLEAHRTASSLRVKEESGSADRAHERWHEHNASRSDECHGRPISFFMTAGHVSDYAGAAALLDGLPKADWLLGDHSHDADWFSDALEEKGNTPRVPGRKSRTKPVKYDKRRYKSCNRGLGSSGTENLHKEPCRR